MNSRCKKISAKKISGSFVEYDVKEDEKGRWTAVNVTGRNGADCERLRRKGVVAKWVDHKGVGFITPEDKEFGGEDLLVHYSGIEQYGSSDGFVSLKEGKSYYYDLSNSHREVLMDS
jgi:cold shock CspA family protein